MGMQRLCPCGFVAVWRRDDLSRLSDTCDVLPLSKHDSPGHLTPSHLQKLAGSSLSTDTAVIIVTYIYLRICLFKKTHNDESWRILCPGTVCRLWIVQAQLSPSTYCVADARPCLIFFWRTQNSLEMSQRIRDGKQLHKRLQAAGRVSLCWAQPSHECQGFLLWVTAQLLCLVFLCFYLLPQQL